MGFRCLSATAEGFYSSDTWHDRLLGVTMLAVVYQWVKHELEGWFCFKVMGSTVGFLQNVVCSITLLAEL